MRFSRKLTNWHSLEVSGIRPCWTCTYCVNRYFLTGRALPDSCSGESSLFWWIIIKPPCCLHCLFLFFFPSFPPSSEKGSYPGTSTWEQTLLLVCLLQHWPAPNKSAQIWYRQDQGQPSLTLAVSSNTPDTMLPRCGSFRSLLPHTLAQHSDLSRELPGFLSREGSWHSSSYAVQSGMLPSPTCLHRDQKKMPLPVVINYKSFAPSHSLSCMAAGALYEMLWDEREGVELPNFIYLIDTFALGFSPLSRSLWRWLILLLQGEYTHGNASRIRPLFS